MRVEFTDRDFTSLWCAATAAKLVHKARSLLVEPESITRTLSRMERWFDAILMGAWPEMVRHHKELWERVAKERARRPDVYETLAGEPAGLRMLWRCRNCGDYSVPLDPKMATGHWWVDRPKCAGCGTQKGAPGA